MPRFERRALMEKFQAMVRARLPIIGGGAGTGISTQCGQAAGIDLIVIEYSGRYRMAGRASSAGLLACGNANDIVLEMAGEVLPVAKKTPVIAGVNGTDPFTACRCSCTSSRRWASLACRTSPPWASSAAPSARAWRRPASTSPPRSR